jgi:hypothetical protein
MGHALQIQRVNQLIYGEMTAEIGLVAQDEEWDALHGWLFQENVELFFGYR